MLKQGRGMRQGFRERYEREIPTVLFVSGEVCIELSGREGYG